MSSASIAVAGEVQEASKGRLASLDVFRGLAVLGMLLVNEKTFGSFTPRQLAHAGWSGGVHLADMVFPWFLLIVGVAIPYAAVRRGRDGKKAYYLGILRRAVSLILLGCLINSSYAKRPMFDFGVLQLIGSAYLVGALLYGLPLRTRLAAAAALLLSHWVILRFLPIPGAGNFTKDLNVAVHLNRAYLANYHLDGGLSVLTTSALVLIGTALGDCLRATTEARRKLAILLTAGVGLLLGGWLWSFDLPLSKPLWTASFVVLAAGGGTLVLAVAYWVVDVRQRRSWAFPLTVAGRNAIFAFCAPILVNLYVLREWHWGDAATAPTLEEALKNTLFAHLGVVPGGFVYTFGYIALWWLILYWMYRRRVFVRL